MKNNIKNSSDLLSQLINIMAQLRDPDTGCPWDVRQNHHTLARYSLEEAYEVVEAVAEEDMVGLKEELGDLLLQVIFHSQIAAENDHFNFDDVIKRLTEKLIHRHPHVFDKQGIYSGSPGTVKTDDIWQHRKAMEKQNTTKNLSRANAAGLPALYPAAMAAQKLQKNVEKKGFSWPAPEKLFAKIDEELVELEQAVVAAKTSNLNTGENITDIEEELGDLLFAITNLGTLLDLDSETALTKANKKFQKRFAKMESLAAEKHIDLGTCDDNTKLSLWNEAKSKLETKMKNEN